jgi:8-oxo-dGTP pyrophosphatase MutT (NUDIX family)
MAIPAVDVKFLRNAILGMKRDELHNYIAGTRRSAQAMVLRWNGPDGVKVSRCFSPLDYGCSTEVVMKRLEQHMDLDAKSSLSMFFMLRADVDESRYSGQVAFPGGLRDFGLDSDDLATARREAFEEVGFPLTSPEFILLGRLPDTMIKSKDIHTEGLIISRFVFLHIGEMTPTLRWSPHEVEAIEWVKIADLSPRNLQWWKVVHPVMTFVPWGSLEARQIVRDYFAKTTVTFPSLPMPNGWHLWGVALGGTSALLRYDGRPRLDFPYFRISNELAQWALVHPYHGYLNIFRGERPIYAAHIISLLFWVFLVYIILEGIYSLLRLWVITWNTAWTFAMNPNTDGFERYLTGGRISSTYHYQGKAEESEDTKADRQRRIWSRAAFINYEDPYKLQVDGERRENFGPKEHPERFWDKVPIRQNRSLWSEVTMPSKPIPNLREDEVATERSKKEKGSPAVVDKA